MSAAIYWIFGSHQNYLRRCPGTQVLTSFSVNTSMKVVVPLQWAQEGLTPEVRRVGLSGYLRRVQV
jgi:hypothetical protein